MSVVTITEVPTEAWMRAVESRDARFDGWVTVGVTSTGIYCRPSCPTPVRPKRTNMTFFATPASAQQAGFRACKRCAPDATPGSPEWNRRDDLVARAIRAIDDGLIDREGVEGLATQLAVSPRHLTRVLKSEIGAGPLALARARRARAARILIETTAVPFSDIAFAAGFDSIRQFNETIRDVFASSPTQLRGRRSPAGGTTEWIELRLPRREPFHAAHLFTWLQLHAVTGIEEVNLGERGRPLYRRSLRLPGGPAVVELSPAEGYVSARFRLADLTDLQQAIQRCRRLLDLDADPIVIEEVLGDDPHLGPLVHTRPGLRSPGEVDGIDAGVRAVLHQQVSLASARAVCARLVREHGTPLASPVGSVSHVFPSAEEWASLDPAMLGMPASRARALVGLAGAIAVQTVDLRPSADRAQAISAMKAVKGIGPWTASVVSLKALADPDAFGSSDLILRRVAGDIGLPSETGTLELHAERWRPWRAYAMHHLWAEYLARSVPSIDDRKEC